MNKFKYITISLSFLSVILFGCNNKDIKSPGLDNGIIELKKSLDRIPSQNFIVVDFGDNIKLKWDTVKNEFVKDLYYNEILKNKKKLNVLISGISIKDDLNLKICSKNTANLKKGDLAFLFLYKNQKIYLFSCLNLQFDVQDQNCKIPENLLDYIEKNRKDVQTKIKDCI